jgi:hypothetical protein
MIFPQMSCAVDAGFRFVGTRLVINSGMDHPGIAARLVRREAVFFFKNSDFKLGIPGIDLISSGEAYTTSTNYHDVEMLFIHGGGILRKDNRKAGFTLLHSRSF